ncbi:MAG: FAD-binding oxidoreductase [Nitrospinota bacterium]
MTDPQRAHQAARDLLGAGRVREGELAAAYALNGLIPGLILYPESCEELSALLAEAYAAHLAVIPWGGGTKQHLGYLPRRCDWVVDLSRFSGISEHQEADFVVTVRAGTTLRQINEFLKERQQHLTLDPLEGDSATVGGISAANSSGPLRIGFGTPRDLILGMEVVMADGTAIRFGAKVVKSVAGYDLNKLYIGSLGTLGFITELTFKTYSLKVQEESLLAGFQEAGAVQSAATRILAQRSLPTTLEWLTGQGLSTEKHLAETAGSEHILLVSFTDNQIGAAKQLAEVESLCRASGAGAVVRLGPERARAMRESLSQAGPFHASAKGLGFACRLGVPLTRVGETVERARTLGRAEGFGVVCQAHTGNGIVRARFGWDEDEEDSRLTEHARRAVEGLQQAARRVGGYAVIETRSLALRDSLDLWDEATISATGLRLMQRAKEALDPKGILNPGRFFGRI